MFYNHEPTPRDDEQTLTSLENEKKEDFWTLYFDRSKTKEGAGVGCVLIDPKKTKTLITCRLEFKCTNNMVEYEALIQGLKKAIDLGVKDLKECRDSEIIVKHVRNLIHFISNRLTRYQQEVRDLLPAFLAFNIFSILCYLNVDADLLANVASQLIPSENFKPNAFSIELIYKPLVSDDVTNLRVFNDDKQIINFLTMEETFKGSLIDEEQHDAEIKRESIEPPKVSNENSIPRLEVKLEKFYDLQDKFKKVTNCKMHSSVMQCEVINLGTLDKPQNINLGVQCLDEENASFVKLFKEYKDVFSWSYDDLKTFDTQVMQHMIPIKEGVKWVQQKLRKMHPSLEPTIKA